MPEAHDPMNVNDVLNTLSYLLEVFKRVRVG